MKVTHIKIRKADTPLTVMDSFVDRGLTEGGHASLPDIDVDYASDRRQEINVTMWMAASVCSRLEPLQP